jgi:hypothetical protein
MRKRLIGPAPQQTAPPGQDWLNLEELAEVEITSENAAYPIEFALLSSGASGWRAGEAGTQTIRLLFIQPHRLRRIWMKFEETSQERTQEYVLRWSADRGQSFREIVRQQWNFSPQGATVETEDHQVELPAVTVLELIIIPDTRGGQAIASLERLRLA